MGSMVCCAHCGCANLKVASACARCGHSMARPLPVRSFMLMTVMFVAYTVMDFFHVV